MGDLTLSCDHASQDNFGYDAGGGIAVARRRPHLSTARIKGNEADAEMHFRRRRKRVSLRGDSDLRHSRVVGNSRQLRIYGYTRAEASVRAGMSGMIRLAGSSETRRIRIL